MYTVLNEEHMLLALGAGAEDEGGSTALGSYERLKHPTRACGGIIHRFAQPPNSVHNCDDWVPQIFNDTAADISTVLEADQKLREELEEDLEALAVCLRNNVLNNNRLP